MARARNLKPGFFKNDDLVELPFETRLLFAGLWTMADREGRLEDRPKKIKMELFPADDVQVDSMLSQLSKASFIMRYEHDGVQYIQIVNFKKHQNPHMKEPASSIPAPMEHGASMVQERCEHDSSPADSLNPITDSPFPDSPSLNPDPGLPSTALSPQAAHAKQGAQLPVDWVLPKSWGEWAMQHRPDLTIERVRDIADQFRDHWRANANQRNAKKSDWEATWRNWVRREKEQFKTAGERRSDNLDRAVHEFLGVGKTVIEGEFVNA